MAKRDKVEIGEEIGQLKERVSQLQRKQLEIETVANKAIIMLEPLKPDFITNLQKHDLNITSLQAKLESLKKVQDSLNERTSKIRKKLDYFDYEEIVEINKEIRDRLKKIERLNTIVQKNEQKTEQMFERFTEAYVEFREFKAMQKKQAKLIDRYNDKIDVMNENMAGFVKQKDLERIKKEIEKIKENLRR